MKISRPASAETSAALHFPDATVVAQCPSDATRSASFSPSHTNARIATTHPRASDGLPQPRTSPRPLGPQYQVEPRRLDLARLVLQTADGRLRSAAPLPDSGRPRVSSAGRAQPVEVDCVLMPTGDRQNTRHHHLQHRMLDAVRIAAIRHCFGEP
jgi:hypothetical protein